MRIKISFNLIACFVWTGAYAAESFSIRSSQEQVQLVELFSSEGCSSCPPADAWLTHLRTNPQLWKTFVPITFHVDYWNRLGWYDRFSSKVFTERQRNYASVWNTGTIYTPAFVRNGEEWRADYSELNMSEKKVGSLSARKIGSNKFEVSFSPVSIHSDWRVYGALLGNGLTTKVLAGENKGKTLRHNFVVLSMLDKKMEKSDDHYFSTIEFPSTGYAIPPNMSVAFWVTLPGELRPVQAVGGDL